MSKEAMKLALEALESCDAAHITDGGHQWYDEKLVDKAITALREALAEQPAQQDQKPMAWVYDTHRGYKIVGYDSKAIAHLDHGTLLAPSTTPQPATEDSSAVQTVVPDAFGTREGEHPEYIQGWNDCRAEMLRGTPAQRTWVGLTDEEKSDIWCVVTNRDFVTEETHVYADAIEAKLKEKNT